ILGVANLQPRECGELMVAWQEGRSQDAGKLQERIAPVHKTAVNDFGVSGVKAALDMMGMHGGAPRPPLLPLGEKRRVELQAVLEAAGLLRATAGAMGD